MKAIKITAKIVFLAASFVILIAPASASVEILDFFSDFTSSDVTVNSTQDIEGKAVFELLYAGSTVESQEVPLKVRAGETAYKVIIWQKKTQYDYYTARVSIYSNSKPVASKTYEVSYNTAALPSFYVVDFTPTNSGVQFLLRPFNPSGADIKIELLDKNDVVYTKTEEAVSLTANTEIELAWPFLLTNNRKYTVRAKVYTHRLYAPPLINSYVSYFTAAEDVEILADDVEVDEYGASVTLRGESQVPFDGYIAVTARNRATNETHEFRVQVEEILVSNTEDTAGVVWRGLAPGTYDVVIRAENQENVTLDKYETAMRIPEFSNVSKAVPAKTTPGFTAIMLLVLLAASRRLKGA